MLTSLERLDLDENQIADEGCAALASALRDGALPALNELYLAGNPASLEARKAACEVPEDRMRQIEEHGGDEADGQA